MIDASLRQRRPDKREDSPLALVSVSGACSRAGKTALAETLLRAFWHWQPLAVKFTTTEDAFERCPRGTSCVVCDIDVPYRIIEDPAVIREPGTDTYRLATAGAVRTIWAISKASAAQRAWIAVRERIGQAAIAVIEGSTVVDLAQPDLLLFVVQPYLPLERWKPTSAALMQRADTVVLNRPARDLREPAIAVAREVERRRGRAGVRVADVTRPLGEWAPDLLARISGLGA